MNGWGWLAALAGCAPGTPLPVRAPATPTTAVPVYPHACDPTIWMPNPTGGAPVAATEAHQEVGGLAPAPFAVHLGWPSSDPSTSSSFAWRTDVETLATVVEYGEGGALDRRVEGVSFRYGGGKPGDGPYRLHEVKLCDVLAPSTTYTYRVGGEVGWSPAYTFTTAPPPGEPMTTRFALAGDSRGSYETWGAVVALMESHDPDVYLFSGDMVELGIAQPEWDSWWAAAGDVFARKPLVPAHGNHEFLSQHYFAQMSLPGNEEWFGARWGDVTLGVLNDTVRDTAVFAGAEAALLEAAFGAAPGDWKIAMHHASEYATCLTHGSNLGLRAVWSPIYDRHGVSLVLSGHNHVYERSVPIHGDELAATGEGTTYIVSGGAGAPLYFGLGTEWFGNVAVVAEHYVIIDVTPSEMHVVARDLAGNVLDDFRVPRSK